MEVQEGSHGEISVLRIKGEVDGEAMAHLEKRIETIFERRSRRIVLNLGEIRYLSSSALEVLLRVAENVDRLGGAFRICRATEAVQRILTLTGLTMRLATDDTEEESVERIRNALCRPGAQFLGDYLVERQVLLPGQLREALQQQMTQRAKNEAVKSLGMILIERGFLDRQQLQQHLLGYWNRRLQGGYG